MRKSLLTSLGGVTAAFAGSLCCAGPLLFVTLGVGSGLASMFEPLRPVFGAAMLGFFALGFHRVYGRRPAGAVDIRGATGGATGSSASGAACSVPRTRSRDAVILWTAVVLALVLWTFPTWAQLLV